MKTTKLHWVFCCRSNNIHHFLGNLDNEPLGYPMLRGLDTEERKLLTESGIGWDFDEASVLYIHCFPGSNRTNTLITAPAYIAFDVGKTTHYKKIGDFTGEWTSPEVIQQVNETIARIIPEDKIHIPGRYVKWTD